MNNETKLKTVERSLYRRVFMARIEGGQSPEAAHRHGLNAVKMWNEVGAFNEEASAQRVDIVSALVESKAWASVGDVLVKNGIDLAELRRLLESKLDHDRDSSG